MPGGEERAGKAGEHGAHGKGRELGIGGVDAERAAGDFILAQGFPGAADRQPPQPHGDEGGQQGQRQDEVIKKDDAIDRAERQSEHGGKAVIVGVEGNAEKRRPRDAADAGIAVGERGEIDDHHANDLAEGERNDGKVVAAQPQYRKAEQNAPERGEDAGDRQQHPERQTERLRQQRIGVSADRVERDVAEVEQTGEPDHDVQSPPEHHIDQNLDAEIVDPFHASGKAGGDEHEGRISDDKSDGEGNEPFADERAPRATARSRSVAWARRRSRGSSSSE